jgi:hypothetical protein
MYSHEERAVAIHEAAHGITAMLLGLDLRHITVERSTRRFGGALLNGTFGNAEPWKVFVFVLAGPLAERAFRGTTSRVQFASADQDLLDLLREATDLSAARVRQLEQLAEAFVLGHELWIRRVADQLLRRRRLSAADVANLRDDDIDDGDDADTVDETGAADDAHD